MRQMWRSVDSYTTHATSAGRPRGDLPLAQRNLVWGCASRYLPTSGKINNINKLNDVLAPRRGIPEGNTFKLLAKSGKENLPMVFLGVLHRSFPPSASEVASALSRAITHGSAVRPTADQLVHRDFRQQGAMKRRRITPADIATDVCGSHLNNRNKWIATATVDKCLASC
jgi:hypothetical protein